jgi:hypothetical protein
VTNYLRTLLQARAAGLDEATARVLLEYLPEHPSERERAFALAVMLRDLGAQQPGTLRTLLRAGVTPDELLFRADRLVSRQGWLGPTGERALILARDL